MSASAEARPRRPGVRRQRLEPGEPGLLHEVRGHAADAEPRDLAGLRREPAAERREGVLMAQRPDHASGHRAGHQHQQRRGQRHGAAGGEDPVPERGERGQGDGLGNRDPRHDPLGEPRRGTHQRQRTEELDDLALGLRALPADQAPGEMVLRRGCERAGEPRVEVVRREMGPGNRGHKWTLLR